MLRALTADIVHTADSVDTAYADIARSADARVLASHDGSECPAVLADGVCAHTVSAHTVRADAVSADAAAR